MCPRPSARLDVLRGRIEKINLKLLQLLNERARVVQAIGKIKQRTGAAKYAPDREQEMLDSLLASNTGPFPNETIRSLFREIFRASIALMDATEGGGPARFSISRTHHEGTRSFDVKGVPVGKMPILIAGPCAVENAEQLDQVAAFLAAHGVQFLRGGAFKPRTSPYAFQGLGIQGLEILRDVAARHGLITVTEVMDTRTVETVAMYADILQVGARNMHNYDLLRELGRAHVPVLLKRGFAATLEELLGAAEYVASSGGERIILCERGIRTFTRETRNTLDIAAIPLLKQQTSLPVIVDVSHAAGRTDILIPLANAALAAGADGIMVEVHPKPALSLSDPQQQLDLEAFERFLRETGLPRLVHARRSGRAPVDSSHRPRREMSTKPPSRRGGPRKGTRRR